MKYGEQLSKALNGAVTTKLQKIEFINNFVPAILNQFDGTKNKTLANIANNLTQIVPKSTYEKSGGDRKKKNRGKGCKVSHTAQIIGKTKIFDEERCLYKVHGSRKKHVYYKRQYIPLTEFKEMRKQKIQGLKRK
jgi:hypothetical protein